MEQVPTNPNQSQTDQPKERQPILIPDKWYDALLKKFPPGWKPDGKFFLYIGFGLLLFLGLIASSASPKAPTSTQAPVASSQPTLPPNINQENPVSQKIFISTKYRFSFMHPGLSEQCCFIVGPTFGTTEAIGNLSDPSSVRRGSDAPFNGLSLYVVDLENMSADEYLKQESQNLKDQYRLANGQDPKNAAWQTLDVNGQPTVLLKNYNSLTVNRYYIKFPTENKLLYLGASEERLGSFNAALNSILRSLTFETASSSASPSPQL